MSVIDRVKNVFARNTTARPPNAPPIHEGTKMTSAEATTLPPLEVQMSDPGPDTDTCKIVLNRELSPDKTEFFESFGEANDWPMVQRIMRVPGVHSVIVKNNILIVAKHAGAEWANLLSPIDVQGSRVFLHMGGGCQGCGMASATLKHGVETALKSQIPEITEIFDTTDHAAGENPFFQSSP